MTAAPASAVVFDTYTDFATYLRGRKCSTCNAAFIQSATDIDTMIKSWFGGAAINSHVKCRKCSRSTCIACFKEDAPLTEKSVNKGRNKVSWCSSRGRLFTIFIMLCGFDQEYCREKSKEASTSSNSKLNVAAGSGVGLWRWESRGLCGIPNGAFRTIVASRAGRSEEDGCGERREEI
jgi:hypothetical protein